MKDILRGPDGWFVEASRGGISAVEVIREEGVSEQTLCRWIAKYAALEVDRVRQMAQLQEGNPREEVGS